MSSTPETPTKPMVNSLGSPMTPTTPLAPGVQQRLTLGQTAIDTWSMKEQLGLASAVLRSGDQNWVSVSRQMKPFSEEGRPADWFSQKNCALQYDLLLGKVDTPRRKGGEKAVESVETPGEVIVRRLTTDRIKELRRVIEAETAELMQLEDECQLLSDDNIDEEKLLAIEAAIEKEEKEESERQTAHEKWLLERDQKKQAVQAALKAHSSKLPLKGAAAAAVQQAGAARRASTQSERSSFSDVDSPLPPPPLPSNQQISREIAAVTNIIPDSNESSPVKKEVDMIEPMEITEPVVVPSLPKPVLPVPTDDFPPIKAPENQIGQDKEKSCEIAAKEDIKNVDGEKSRENVDDDIKTEPEKADLPADATVNTDKKKEVSDDKTEPDTVSKETEKVATPPVVPATEANTTDNTSTVVEKSQENVRVKEEVVTEEEEDPANEKESEDADKSADTEEKDISFDGLLGRSEQKEPTAVPAATVDCSGDKAAIVEDDDDDEVIIKREIEEPIGDADKKNLVKPGQQQPKLPRTKKISELLSEDDDISNELDGIGGRSRGRDTRNKKISERSDEAEESPGPPTSRATRRSKKVDASNDGSTDREETGGPGVENKRLSRVKETDPGAGRGRRGSGATNPTTGSSRSSSPVGSGDDESEVDMMAGTPNRGGGSRVRKKSGRGPTGGNEIDSAPGSPSPSGASETSNIRENIAENTDAAALEDTSVSGSLEEWKKCAIVVLDELKSHKFADRVFSVLESDATDDNANSIIIRTMDISLIRKNIDNGLLKSNTDLHHALHHMFLNLVMSTAADSEEHEMALTIFRDCITQMDELRSLSLDAKSPIGKAMTKSREKRDSVTSSTPIQDDVHKRKRSLEDTPISSNKRRKR